MVERRIKFYNALVIFGLAFSQTACGSPESSKTAPVESCPPTHTAELGQGAWLSMEIGQDPFIFPLSVEDPNNPSNQAQISIVDVIPNEGTVVRIQMLDKDPQDWLVNNDLDNAIRFSEADIGMQFWACGEEDSTFFRLVPLNSPITDDSA